MKQSNPGLNIIVYRDYIGYGADQFQKPQFLCFRVSWSIHFEAYIKGLKKVAILNSFQNDDK